MAPKPKPKPRMTPEEIRKRDAKSKKKVMAVTMDPDVLTWAKEWAAKRDRSLSWAVNFLVKDRMNRELAEKHLGKKLVRPRG